MNSSRYEDYSLDDDINDIYDDFDTDVIDTTMIDKVKIQVSHNKKSKQRSFKDSQKNYN